MGHRHDLLPTSGVQPYSPLDARLFDPPPGRPPGTRGRPAKKGPRQPTLAQRLDDPATSWSQVTVCDWYGGVDRRLEIATGTALWSGSGWYAPIRYILVRDSSGQLEPQSFLCTDPTLEAVLDLTWFVRRWCIEVRFAEVRRHLGVETQRQWSDLVIACTTPMLLGLFSLVSLWANTLITGRQIAPRVAPCYPKPQGTFSDALAAVRRHLWVDEIFGASRDTEIRSKSDADIFDRLIDVACFPA